jgi:hypothetical protein
MPVLASPSCPLDVVAVVTWSQLSCGSRRRVVVALAVATTAVSWLLLSSDACRRVVITATGVRVVVTRSRWWWLGVGYEGDAGSMESMW